MREVDGEAVVLACRCVSALDTGEAVAPGREAWPAWAATADRVDLRVTTSKGLSTSR